MPSWKFPDLSHKLHQASSTNSLSQIPMILFQDKKIKAVTDW